MKLREAIGNESNERYTYLLDLLVDAGIPLDQEIQIEENFDEECVVIPGKSEILVYFQRPLHSTGSIDVVVSSSRVSSSVHFGKMTSLDMDFMTVGDESGGGLYGCDRQSFVKKIWELFQIKDQSHVDQAYFDNRIEFVRNQLLEIQKEYTTEFSDLISKNQQLSSKLSEISAIIFGMTKNGKQQYH